jgi:putative membrane protein
MWGMGWFGSMVMASFWVLIFLGLVHLLRSTTNNNELLSFSQDRLPREILKERYARGEIEQEEYEEKKKILEPGV